MEGHIGKGKVLVREIVPEEKTIKGVIVLAETQRRGVVELIGDEVDEVVEVGKTVVYGQRVTKVNIDFTDYLLMPCDNILYVE